MSKGTFAPLLLLLISSLLLVGIITILIVSFNALPGNEHISGLPDHNTNFLFLYYATFLRMLDPGVVSNDPSSNGFAVFMMIATLFGLIMISVLIAIINNGVMNRLNNLRKGKSFVVEKDHVVILGWSFQVFPVIHELIIANENKKENCIVILADKDKIYMEDEIRAKIFDSKNTRIVCRTGNPIDIHDLNIVNLNQARSIIIIAPDVNDPDSNVIKTILAITNNPHRKPVPEKYHIVAEIRDPRNIVIAEIAGREEVQLVVFDHLISRITAQTCRQPGLSVVFTELLDFDGDEVYFKEEPLLYGKSFVEAMFSYETSTLIGIRKADGTVLIKPQMDTVIQSGDMVIAISMNYDTVIMSGMKEYSLDPHAIIQKSTKYFTNPENTLIIGWNRRATLIINELDNYVSSGSKVTVLTDHHSAEKDITIHCSDLLHQTIKYVEGDTTNRKILDELIVWNYDHVIVLSESESQDIQASDAKTLSTLLHLRDIADKSGETCSIVSEMLDDRNRELAEVTNTDDFIVSVKLDSLMLSQMSENKELRHVFEDLFSAGGSQIYLRPAEDYIELDRPVNFYTVMESARQKNQISIGFKTELKESGSYNDNSQLSHGVVVNPKKSKPIFFSKTDKIIVISEE